MDSPPLPPPASSAPPDPAPTATPSSSSPAVLTPSLSSGSLSLVSRAKTALHSAAAKAEKVLTDIKTEIKSDRDSDGKSMRGRRMSVDRDLSDASKEVIEKSSNVVDCSSSSKMLMMPPASAIRQLALAIENAKNIKSINDLSKSAGDPPPIKEKSGLSFSSVKSLVLREKEDKEEIRSLACSLFKSEESFPLEKDGSESRNFFRATVLKDLHGAPPESFLVQVSQAIAGFKSIQKMASFWQYITVELKNMWAEGQPIPQMPLDADPDLDCCLLHQQLQVINCSIARKRRRSIAKESLDSLIIKGASPDREGSLNSSEKTSPSYNVFAKTKSGDYVLRLGAVQPSENLIMLETGEPVFSPVTQEGPVFTEELIKETEALVLQTGSVGPGCSQLLSDMQSFKAANPGCILEDFVRWYSPPDWSEVESDDEPTVVDEEGSSRRGRLSIRMQKEGNLWLQLWEAAKALPAVNQAPIFDEDVEVESILTTLGSIQPSDLFEQLFVSLLSAGFIIAEASVPRDDNLAKLFAECKHFVTAAYQSGQSNEKLKDICQVYETVEVIIHHPEEVIKPTEQPQPDDTAATESKAEPNTEPKIESKTDPKSRFKKLNLMRKEMQPPWKRSSRDDNKSEEKSSNIFSQIFDKKTSLFPKKSPKTTAPTPAPTTSNLDDNEWMIV